MVTLALSPLGGTLIDRFGARRVVLPCLLIEAVGTGSLALVDSTGSALAVLTLIAIGSSAIWSGQNTILASLTDDGERQRVFGLNFALLNLGIGIGGMISGAIVDTARPVTFQTIYLLDAVSYLMPALILLTLPGVGRRLGRPPTARRPAVGRRLPDRAARPPVPPAGHLRPGPHHLRVRADRGGLHRVRRPGGRGDPAGRGLGARRPTP